MTQEGAKYHGASDDIIAQAKEAYKNSYYENQDSAKAEADANAFLDKALQKNETPPPAGTEEPEPKGVKATPSGKFGGVWYEKEGYKGKKGEIDTSEDIYILGFNSDGKWAKINFTDKKTGNKQDGFIRLNEYGQFKDLKKIKSELGLGSYSKGGIVDYTGLAMVHGSKSKPESFISAEHTKLLKSTIFSPHNNALEKLREVYENYKNASSGISNSNDSNINIENINISVETGAISNGYDARRAGQEIFDEMVRISRKTANVKVSRR